MKLKNIIEIDPLKIENSLFDNKNDNIHVLIIWAKWCVACKQMLPMVNEASLRPEFKFLKFHHINVADYSSKETAVIKRMFPTLNAIPFFVGTHKGKIQSWRNGMTEEELDEFLKSLNKCINA